MTVAADGTRTPGPGGPARGTGRRDASPPEAGGEAELRVESIAGGGDGVARQADGRVVFVPRAAPGDRLRARIVEERRSWARGRIVELLEPGSGRREPPCPYYAVCGGCQLQHLGVPEQREARRRIVEDALRRIGGLDLEVPPLETAGPELGYRTRIALTLRRGEDGVTAGYHRFDRPAELVDVAECPLAEPAVNRAWRALRDAWGEGARRLPGGRELRITVRGSASGEVSLVVQGGEASDPGDPEGVADAVPALRAYHWRDASGRRRRLAGRETLEDVWSGLSLGLRPEAFLQVNRAVSEAMDRHLEERLGPAPGRRLLDLYAGVALRGLRWALAGAEVAACEVGGDAVETAREAARTHGAEIRIVRGRLEDRLDALLPADGAVVNPPRAGLSRPVSRRLALGGAGKLAYVSCDPATLARDLRRLGEGWSVEEVRAFDAFPQTAHVETIAWLRWTGGGGT